MPEIGKKRGPGFGLALALAAPFLYTAFNLSFKLVSRDVTSLGLLLERGLVGMAAAGILARLSGSRPPGGGAPTLALAGLSAATSTACVTGAITMIHLYQVMVIVYLYPAISVLLGRVMLGERIGPAEALGVLAAFAGCVLLVWPGGGAGFGLSPGHFLALAGAALFALACVLIRRLGDSNDGLWPFFSYSFFSALIAYPLSVLFGTGLGIDGPGEAAAGAAVAVVGSLAQLVTYAALRYLPAFRVGVLGSLEVLGGALGGWLFFAERMTARGVAGGALIVCAAFGFRGKRGDPGAGGDGGEGKRRGEGTGDQ